MDRTIVRVLATISRLRCMGSGHQPQTTWLRVAGLLVVLAGLFGMHGLGSHGAAGMGSTSYAAMGGSAMETMSSTHHVVSVTPRVGAALAVSASGEPATDMSMTGMCLAVLTVALLGLLGLLRSTRSTHVLWVYARQARGPGYFGRHPDPPCLTSLSIQRC